MKDISVVIPVYNSSENLDELYKQLKDALQSIAYEIIFVDDCSSDNSWGEICRMAQIDSTITAVGLRKNSGQDNALMAGFSYAEGNYICIMDDDLQHSPYDIPALYEQCRKGYDVCYAGFSHFLRRGLCLGGCGCCVFFCHTIRSLTVLLLAKLRRSGPLRARTPVVNDGRTARLEKTANRPLRNIFCSG